jgi:NCS1 family nucleobase:cation symporter-1
VIPNFYGFLNNMGVGAPVGVTRFYYFAYWVGLAIAGFTYWAGCKLFPPVLVETGWKEPKNYIRPEEDGATPLVVEGVEVPPENTSDMEKSSKNVSMTVV